MCGRITTVTWDELMQVAQEISSNVTLNASPDWPAQPMEAFPKSSVPLVAAQASQPDAVDATVLRWGYALEGKRDVIFNTRVETAATSPLWRESYAARRCVVPVHAFYEPHREETAVNPKTGRTVKQTYRFASSEGPLLLLAGIWKGDRFSVLTTQPDAQMAPIHPRMPVMLDVDSTRKWLSFESAPKPEAELLRVEPIYPEPLQGTLF